MNKFSKLAILLATISVGITAKKADLNPSKWKHVGSRAIKSGGPININMNIYSDCATPEIWVQVVDVVRVVLQSFNFFDHVNVNFDLSKKDDPYDYNKQLSANINVQSYCTDTYIWDAIMTAFSELNLFFDNIDNLNISIDMSTNHDDNLPIIPEECCGSAGEELCVSQYDLLAE